MKWKATSPHPTASTAVPAEDQHHPTREDFENDVASSDIALGLQVATNTASADHGQLTTGYRLAASNRRRSGDDDSPERQTRLTKPSSFTDCRVGLRRWRWAMGLQAAVSMRSIWLKAMNPAYPKPCGVCRCCWVGRRGLTVAVRRRRCPVGHCCSSRFGRWRGFFRSTTKRSRRTQPRIAQARAEIGRGRTPAKSGISPPSTD